MASEESSWVTVARILRAHGRRGEVACEILTDFPDHLKRLTSVELCDASVEPRQGRSVQVRSCWISGSRGGQAIYRFEGSDSISDAEKLVGLEVQIPIAERVELPPGSYYVTDLIGCEVVMGRGTVVGIVNEVQSTGEGIAGTPILLLDSAQGELLIPLAQEICVSVDTAGKRIEIAPPEGLLDLNSSP